MSDDSVLSTAGHTGRFGWGTTLAFPRIGSVADPEAHAAAQFKNVLVVILLAATLLQGLLGRGLEAAVIAVMALTVALAFTVVPVLEAVKWCERHGYLGELR